MNLTARLAYVVMQAPLDNGTVLFNLHFDIGRKDAQGKTQFLHHSMQADQHLLQTGEPLFATNGNGEIITSLFPAQEGMPAGSVKVAVKTMIEADVDDQLIVDGPQKNADYRKFFVVKKDVGWKAFQNIRAVYTPFVRVPCKVAAPAGAAPVAAPGVAAA
jgi:hypothetical protein